MKRFGLTAYALTIGVASALLAGCGGSQPPIDQLGTMQSGAAIQHRAKSGAQFLYVAAKGNSYVLSFPKGKLAGTIDSGAFSTCADTSGNAFLTFDTAVTEFHNGGTTPTKTLEVGGTAAGCASDPMTGKLAVMFESSDGNVAIFPNASGSPTVYHDNIRTYYGSYDNEGNLFIDGLTSTEQFVLTELPEGSGTFETIAITPKITLSPGQVQWDGQYVTVEGLAGAHAGDATTIYRLQVSGSAATVAGAAHFRNAGRAVGLSWITGSQVLLPFGTRSDKGSSKRVGVWKYPAGGKRAGVFKGFPGSVTNLNGVSVTSSK
jgi:hypothetical protein